MAATKYFAVSMRCPTPKSLAALLAITAGLLGQACQPKAAVPPSVSGIVTADQLFDRLLAQWAQNQNPSSLANAPQFGFTFHSLSVAEPKLGGTLHLSEFEDGYFASVGRSQTISFQRDTYSAEEAAELVRSAADRTSLLRDEWLTHWLDSRAYVSEHFNAGHAVGKHSHVSIQIRRNTGGKHPIDITITRRTGHLF